MTDTFSTQMTLPYSAITANGIARADWLLNAFQDTASQHCHMMRVSGIHMAKKGLKWVVAQNRMKIHSPVNWLTPFTLNTWRYPWKNLYEVRQSSVTALDGTCLVEAAGIWILIKADTGRPVRLNRHLPEELMQVQGTDPELIKTHSPIEAPDHTARFRVLFQDLDLNQHVNNGVYLKWALESLPHPHGFNYVPVAATVSYLKECFYPGTVDCRVAEEKTAAGLATAHEIVRPKTREILARVSLHWQKNQISTPFFRHG